MQKDVIYIDVEDDITSIIGKVKEANNKIVAIVPPKRVGAIQSAVNLKLVQRAAEQDDKKLVLITNNPALTALAASASIPIAKNLQSKPEVADIPTLAIDDDDDIINGEELMPNSSSTKETPIPESSPVEAKSPRKNKIPQSSSAIIPPINPKKTVASPVNIPSFDKFRKKLFIGLGALLLLIGFLVWAIIFAPSAKIIVNAKTSQAALGSQAKIGDALPTSLKDGTIKSITKTSKKDISKEFAATGKKDVGEKATGVVSFSSGVADIVVQGATIPAGTVLTSVNGSQYTTDNAVSLSISNYRGAKVGITAVKSGTSSNGADGTLKGAPEGIRASIASTTSGGTDKTVSVVQAGDVEAAKDGIVSQADIDAAKKDLSAQFGKDVIVIDSAFKADSNGLKPSPAVGSEATGDKATLAGSVVFSMTAIAKQDMIAFLDAYFTQQVDGKSQQKVYDNGIKDVSITNVNAVDGGYQINIATNGKIGPKIDENKLKDFAKGKKIGEIQDHIRQVNGVNEVDIKLSPFWVNTVPNDTKKISVSFKVND